MATDATGTPTSPDGIPTYNTSVDAPSGLGANAIVAAIQTALVNRILKPLGILTGEFPVYNGTTFDRSTTTRPSASSLGTGTPDATKFLRGDGAWTVPTVAGSLVGVQVLAGSGTYTPTAGTTRVWVECVGGAGAGGGCPAVAGAYAGGGGGAGAYAASLLTSGFSGAAYSVGAGGTGTTGAGGNGGDTTWGTTVIVAKGGTGAAVAVASTDAAGGAGGLASGCTGQLKIDGQDGDRSTLAGGSKGGGSGGDSMKGFGARMFNIANANGLAGKGFGGGGSGVLDASSGVARTGGNGSAGTIIVWEFA